jgi:hypothetical protein
MTLRKRFKSKHDDIWEKVSKKMVKGKKGTKMLRRILGDKFVDEWEKEWAMDRDED